MSEAATSFKTRVTATLAVQDWARAVDFYKTAFGATELHRVPGGGVVQLSVRGAEFWVAEESKEHLNFSPKSLGWLFCSDAADRGRPGRGVQTGCCGRSDSGLSSGRRPWMAYWPNC